MLYASDSIVDILGYAPDDVIGKSCFEYFHPDEIPFARGIHGRGVELDKAAVLSYCRIRSKDGRWVGCECCFTVVYDVLVASTSIYRRGMKSQSEWMHPRTHSVVRQLITRPERAVEAPIVRRLFSSSPKDPRYHMLSLLSSKFSQGPARCSHEPRAAMFLNRFTRTLAIMYATTALSSVLGITPDEAKGKSFYECIEENCLADAIRCLESAKANDSIAYMRFWFRDPRQPEQADDPMVDARSSSGSSGGGVEDEEEDGGIYLNGHANGDDMDTSDVAEPPRFHHMSSSGNTTDLGPDSNEAVFGHDTSPASSGTSVPSPERDHVPGHCNSGSSKQPGARQTVEERIEVEAVVSCTSDGLVVVLRRARPVTSPPDVATPSPVYTNGLFASPWAATPIMPGPPQQHPFHGAFLPDLAAAHSSIDVAAPPMDGFMSAIREVAVFAWSLTGINGNLVQYGRGKPTGESQPPGGMPVWEPTAKHFQRHGPSGSGDWRPQFDGMQVDGIGNSRPDGYHPTNNIGQGQWSGIRPQFGYAMDGGIGPRSGLNPSTPYSGQARWLNGGSSLHSSLWADSALTNHNGFGQPPQDPQRVLRGFNDGGLDHAHPGATDGAGYATWHGFGPALASGVDGGGLATYNAEPAQGSGPGGRVPWL